MTAGALVLTFAAGFATPYLLHWLSWQNGKRRKHRARDFFGGDS